jgi:hypothetical protein
MSGGLSKRLLSVFSPAHSPVRSVTLNLIAICAWTLYLSIGMKEEISESESRLERAPAAMIGGPTLFNMKIHAAA